MRMGNNRRISLGENGRCTLRSSKGAYRLPELACRISHVANGTGQFCRTKKVVYVVILPQGLSCSLARDSSEFDITGRVQFANCLIRKVTQFWHLTSALQLGQYSIADVRDANYRTSSCHYFRLSNRNLRFFSNVKVSTFKLGKHTLLVHRKRERKQETKTQLVRWSSVYFDWIKENVQVSYASLNLIVSLPS